jgi:hypothetical protein
MLVTEKNGFLGVYYHWIGHCQHLSFVLKGVAFNPTFRLYEVVKKHFESDDDARELVSAVEDIVAHYVHQERENAATKMDVMDLKADIFQVRSRIKQSFRQQTRQTIFLFSALVVIIGLMIVFIT